MEIQDVKVGEMYNLKLLAVENFRNLYVTFETPTELKICVGAEDFEAVSPINPYTPLMLETTTVIPETYPKYDPCRKFREGDIVTPCDVKGRWLSDYWKNKAGQHFVVTKDESGGEIPILDIKAKPFEVADYLPAVCFELVTPVEELEPYFIEETEYEYCVTIMVGERKDTPATYHKRMHPHAKEAAEAERDRLNAKYRKELK